MANRILALLMAMVMWGGCVYAADKRFTLVIDPGHGGHDTGALGARSKEKDINLKVALAFGAYVERNCKDVKVVYTREKDVFIPLMTRANIANKNNADLFISIHTNALPKGKIARGFETYTLGMHRAKDNLDVAMRENSVISMEKGYQQTYQGFDPNSSESYIMFELIQDKNMEKSVALASMIQRNVCRVANRPNKGVHQAGFLVLRETSMPSCLIELGFITTPDEETALNNSGKIDAMARGIYQAFVEYKQKHGGGGSYKVEASVPNVEAEPVKEKKRKKEEAQDKETTPVKETRTGQEPAPQEQVANKVEASGSAPVFMVQILASDAKLAKGDRHFKGETEWQCYQENGMYKYTIGASTDYNEINRLRKKLADKFPQAFVIAFKDGAKYDVVQAIREFKANR